jgi:WD40 repeat protein
MLCPYIGLRAYKEAESRYFFGREREIRVIASNLYASPITILYGGSGVGKSSVLLAGVIPPLRLKPHTAVVVFCEWQSRSFLNSLKSDCLEAVDRAPGSALKIDPALPLDELLLAASEKLGGTILIILDQFEEYFLYHPTSDPDNDFDAELARSVNRVEVDANILVAMREDGLAKLDRFDARIPNLLGNTLRLEHLDREQAEQAIRGPLAQYKTEHGINAGPTDIEDGLVDAVLAQVTTEANPLPETPAAERDQARIETPLLQLVMQRLWDEEREEGSSKLRLVTLDQRLKGVKSIVQQHLNEVMDTLSEQQEDVCSSFFDRLVTPSGTKFAQRQADLAQWAGHLGEPVQPVLEQLDKRGILRTINPPPGDEDVRYEIVHDVLAKAILAWQANHLQEREQTRQKAAAEAALKARELEHQKEREHQEALLGEQRQRADAQFQLAQEKERAAKRSQKFAWSMFIVAIAAIGVAIFAYREFKNAQKQELIAHSRGLVAAAVGNLGIDPERGVLLARRALSDLRQVDKQGAWDARDAMDALNRTAHASRSRLTLPLGESLWTASFSRDGKRVAFVTADDKTVKVRDTTSSKLIELKGHTQPVRAMQFSPDGKHIATGGADKLVKLWDAASGKALQTFSGHTDTIEAVSFSAQGTLASAGDDGKAIIWNDASDVDPRALSGHEKGQFVSSLAFSPDGTRLVTASTDRTAIIWDIKSERRLHTLRGHTDRIGAMAFSRDGKIVATGGDDRKVILWEANSGKPLRILRGHTNSIFGIAFSSGDMLATASADSTARIWEAGTGNQLFELAGHTRPVNAIAFSPDDARVETASWDGTIKVWDVTHFHTDGVVNVAVSPDGTRIASASRDHTAKIWDAAAEHVLFTLRGHSGELTAIAFSPDGRLIATASEDKTARVWDARSGKRLFANLLVRHDDFVMDIAFSPDSSRLATASQDGTVKLWDVRNGKKLRTLQPERDLYSVGSVTFSPRGAEVVGANEGGAVNVWNAQTGKIKQTLEPHHLKQVRKLAFSSDGAHLASVDDDGNIGLWQWPTLNVERLIAKGHKDMIMSAAFNPDGSRLATGSLDNTAVIWDVKNGKGLSLTGHANAVVKVAFSPDGKRVATASWDRSAKVWDAFSGQELFTFSHEREVTDVAFTRDGKGLVTVSEDRNVRLNYLEAGDLVEAAKSRVTRPLTPTECRKFLPLDTCAKQ